MAKSKIDWDEPEYTPAHDFDKVPEFEGDVQTQRRQFARWLLPQRKATGKYVYSAAGYLIAAAMAETVTSKSWEVLMEEYLFEPLGVDAVIGWPASLDRAQPWGHSDISSLAEKGSPQGAVRPHAPDDKWGINLFSRPAGDVSMSIAHYMRFLREHLRGLKGQSSLMSQGAFEFLHAPAKETNSACGWGINTNVITGLEVHGHAGCAWTFYMIAGVFPENDFAVAVVANAGSGEASAICKDVITAMISLYWDWRQSITGEQVAEPDRLKAAG